MRLTQEQAAIRETARQFSAREIAPYVRAWEKNQETPRALYKAMGEAGLMGMCINPEYGGAGADFVSYVLAMEELARVDCGIANMWRRITRQWRQPLRAMVCQILATSHLCR